MNSLFIGAASSLSLVAVDGHHIGEVVIDGVGLGCGYALPHHDGDDEYSRGTVMTLTLSYDAQHFLLSARPPHHLQSQTRSLITLKGHSSHTRSLITQGH